MRFNRTIGDNNYPTLNPHLELKEYRTTETSINDIEIQSDLQYNVLENYYPKTDTLIATYPDGRKVMSYSDGRTKTKYPDGREVKCYSDGKTKRKYPDGIKVKNYSDGTISVTYPDEREVRHYPNRGVINVKYPDGKQERYFLDGEVRTTTPNELIKTEYPNGDIAYKSDMNEDALFKVWAREDGLISIIDIRKDKKKCFYPDGRVNLYKYDQYNNCYNQCNSFFAKGPILRRALPDGTQIKEFEQGNLMITKRLGPQTKTAEYITSSGESIPLLRKNYKNNERTLLNIADSLSNCIKNKILQEKNFSRAAKELKDVLKNLKMI